VGLGGGQRDVTGVEGQGVEGTRWPGVGVGAKSRASGIWGRGVKGGDGGTEVGGGVEGGGGGAEVEGGVEGGSGVEGGCSEGGSTKVGQPDGAKPYFATIRVSRRRGYSPYTRYIFGIG
jgi:hypothetical protein